MLQQAIDPVERAGDLVKQTALVIAGVLVLAISAKVRLTARPSPVPITLGMFAVLSIGAAYGPRPGPLRVLA
ncbi:MAG: hypothetical protein AAFV19_05490 [Pseudomonadota bacterium]